MSISPNGTRERPGPAGSSAELLGQPGPVGESVRPAAPIKVLVVDDHAMFAEGLLRLLEAEDDISIVGTATTAREAVTSAHELRPDVVLMDYDLPDGDGTGAVARIVAQRPETRVVMLTAFADDAVVQQALEAGCCGYVTKQKAVDEVVYAVRAAHAGEALISPAVLARLLPKLDRRYRPPGTELTARELDVLRLLVEGMSNQDIANRLSVRLNTVRNHVQNILLKLNAHSKLEAVATAVREGIVSYR